MKAPTRELVTAAQAGETVYIGEVRRRFAALGPAASFTVRCTFRDLDGAPRPYDLTLPRFEGLAEPERGLAIEYFLASLYNIVSTIGGEELRLQAAGDPPELGLLADAFVREFGLERSRRDRSGYGRAINVAERMIESLSGRGATPGRRFRCTLDRAAPAAPPPPPAPAAAAAGGILEVCRDAVQGLERKILCGIDVGGTDIKLALAVRGKVVRFMEYDWFPASFTAIDQLIHPIVVLTRLMRLEALRAADAGAAAALGDALEPAFAPGAEISRIAQAVEAGERRAPGAGFRLDGIGLCFPDVVVRDKIVGGEVYKTRGIRENPAIDYEREFRKLSHLDEELRAWVGSEGVVGIVNDGPMAAFTAAVEAAAADPRSVESGVFAHTLGTELGTGWVTEAGAIPDIPLEVYNCVIDLGSYPERRFEPDDARSVNNFNTRLPGTLQKYTSQSGVFRLAAKYLPRESPALWREIRERGFLVEEGDSLKVPTAPKDLRKPFLEFLMRIPERGGEPAVDRIFREMGEFLAVAFRETEFLLAPRARERILFGRLVKHRPCFALMLEGARRIEPSLVLGVADDELANTRFMQELEGNPHHTVAQFAQAIGAIHYANHRHREAARRAGRAAG
ncbi:MAG TPA: hypothetical protein VMU15_15930 [Anaeromyxobacter sp.]|nr:hypothetical protein [Anaeromyxobacter sp.]